MGAVVPFYLTPSFLKKPEDSTELQGPVKIILNPMLKKRDPKARSKSERFVMIDPAQEEPEYMDATQLRSFSNRREWKRRHGHTLKKKRLTKKDIKKGKHI